MSIKLYAKTYDGVRNATPEELLEAVIWGYTQEDDYCPAYWCEKLLRIGFAVAQTDGWEQVAPYWLREAMKEKQNG